MITTRFAPSPNGPLHLGHAFAAITAHDLAHDLKRAEGGRFVLRIEDIDGVRSQPELADAFREDLRWLGLRWEEVPPQSARLAQYRDASARLKSMGLLYPCTCTRAQIAAAAQATGPEGPLYPGTCRDTKNFPDSPAAWRLDVRKAAALTGKLLWEDALQGVQEMTPELLGDVVLVRKDNPASYHLAATLDDAADGVTLVTRGQDLFTASHIHRLLQALLNLPVPKWHHHPLVLDEHGEKLAKRRGSQSLAHLRAQGVDGIKLGTDLRAGRYPPVNSLSKA